MANNTAINSRAHVCINANSGLQNHLLLRLYLQTAKMNLARTIPGQSMKLDDQSIWEKFKSSLSKVYLTSWKGFKVR